jgi:hypothetical protein
MRRPSGPSYEGYHLERRDSRGRKVYVSEHFSLVAATRFEEQDSQ